MYGIYDILFKVRVTHKISIFSEKLFTLSSSGESSWRPGYLHHYILFSDTCDVRNNCHPNASCLYSDALHSYTCICNENFEGDGFTCEVEVVSCAKVDNCDPHATCSYDEKLGRSKCVCNLGYFGDGYTCAAAGKTLNN